MHPAAGVSLSDGAPLHHALLRTAQHSWRPHEAQSAYLGRFYV